MVRHEENDKIMWIKIEKTSIKNWYHSFVVIEKDSVDENPVEKVTNFKRIALH